MLLAVVIIPAIYAIISVLFLTRRLLKILDLHYEFSFVRSKEQKMHVKIYAQNLRNDFKKDLAWPRTYFNAIKQALIWLKTGI